MTIAIAQSPALPLPGQTVTLSATGTAGTLREWEITAVPSGSTVTLAKVPAFGAKFVADVPGVYSVKVYDWTRNYTPAAFDGDSAAAPTVTLAGTASGSIYVADRLTRKMGAGQATIDLTMLTLNATVVGAMLSGARTADAADAALNTTVRAKLAACTAIAPSALDAALHTKAANLLAKYEAHRVRTTSSTHANADTANYCRQNQAPTDTASALLVLNDLRTQFVAHMASATLGGTVAGMAHTWPDTVNVVLAAAATDAASGHALADDLWRAFESHRVATTGTPGAIHGAADTANALTAQLPLAALQSYFITTAASASTVAGPGEQSATTSLIQSFGFAPQG